MDCKKPENKAKLMKKRNVRLVHEHFEDVLTLLSGFLLFVQCSQLLIWPSTKCSILSIFLAKLKSWVTTTKLVFNSRLTSRINS